MCGKRVIISVLAVAAAVLLATRRKGSAISLSQGSVWYFARPHTSIPKEPLSIPAAWTGKALRDSNDWFETMPAHEAQDWVAMVKHSLNIGKELKDMTVEDCPFASESQVPGRLRQWKAQLSLSSNGTGFVFVRNAPVQSWQQSEQERFFWCLGLHLGTPHEQNNKRELLGHVRDVGADPRKDRQFKTAAEIAFHVDAADVVGLLTLKSPKSGGVSKIISSVTVYNELLKRYGFSYAERLFSSFLLDTRGSVRTF